MTEPPQDPESPPPNGAQQICVTGASGYIGSHVVRELLERGYRVKATVREPQDPERCEHLRRLPGAERLTLVQADVLNKTDWQTLLEDCDGLIHCAAAVRMGAKDPQAEIVDVALKGTTHVLLAASRSARTRHVVQLSSVAAMISYDKPADYEFSSDDWCQDATVQNNPYGLGKTLSERVAWELAKPSEQGSGYRLVAINPAVVFGPILAARQAQASVQVVHDILAKVYPGCPPISFSIVDVRDVATACVNALENVELSRRFCLSHQRLWWKEIAREFNQLLPGIKLRTNSVPRWLIYAVALFEPRISLRFLKQILGRETRLEGQSALKALGLQYRPLADTLLDSARSLSELGVLELQFADVPAALRAGA